MKDQAQALTMTSLLKARDFLLCLLLGAFLFLPSHPAAAEEDLSPVTNHGKKWRIGYFQGGEWYEFDDALRATAESLMEIGWIEKKHVPRSKELPMSSSLWSWLSKNTSSEYIEFVEDGFYDGGWKEDVQNAKKTTITERTKNKKDIDMIMAMGTDAGKLLSEISDSIVMTICSTNAVEAKISKGYDLSGKKNIFAVTHPDRYKNEIKLFHRIFKFNRLGIAYLDTEIGMIYAAIEDVRSASKELGFAIKECKYNGDYVEIIACYERLAPEVDAMYMVEGLEESDMEGSGSDVMRSMLRPMLKNHIPTWSQVPFKWKVEYGTLMGLSGADPADLGIFQAKVMARIFRGTPPGEINQIFRNPKSESITLNLKTAHLIEYNPDWEVLAAAEKVYEEIKGMDASDPTGDASRAKRRTGQDVASKPEWMQATAAEDRSPAQEQGKLAGQAH